MKQLTEQQLKSMTQEEIINYYANNLSYQNVDEVAKTDWTPVQMKIPFIDENNQLKFKLMDEPMIPLLKFSKHAKNFVYTKVIPGDYEGALLECKTHHNITVNFPIHRDCDCSLGDSPAVKDILVVRLLKGEYVEYTTDTLTQAILDKAKKAGCACFKVIW